VVIPFDNQIGKDNEIVTPLVTQISWTNHMLIMSGSKIDEEVRLNSC
jgi:hypothetical protein